MHRQCGSQPALPHRGFWNLWANTPLWLIYSCNSSCSSTACPELHAKELSMSSPNMWHAASALLAIAVPEFECRPAFSTSSVHGAGNAGLEAGHWDALLNMAWCPVLTVCPAEGKQALVCTTALCQLVVTAAQHMLCLLQHLGQCSIGWGWVGGRLQADVAHPLWH